MMYPQFFPQVLAEIFHGNRIADSTARVSWPAHGAVAVITKESAIEKAIEAPMRSASSLSMQWMVSVDADGNNCLRAQWESSDLEWN